VPVTELGISVTAFVIDYILDVNVENVLVAGKPLGGLPDRLSIKACDAQTSCFEDRRLACEVI
jgi:hypothetical protein